MVYEIDREEMCRKINERKGHVTCGLHISLQHLCSGLGWLESD